jgi:tripartite-type tricarboxylate transporter receptor subunit TctC
MLKGYMKYSLFKLISNCILVCCQFTFLILSISPALAIYPERPVRLIIGFPPGGAADILGRVAGDQMTDALGKQVVIDNRGGAGGLIATEIAARSIPDGYTLLFTSIPHVINPHLYKKVNYDAVKDFLPVVQFVSVPLVLAASPLLTAKSVRDLIVYAQSNPDRLSYGSGGSGASSHLAMELFKSTVNIRITHIPYKGTGPLITDMLGGQIALTIASIVPMIPHFKSGKLRPLGVTSKHRAGAFPDIPSISESVANYEVVNWFGIVAPVKTPIQVIDKINQVVNTSLKNNELIRRLHNQGADPVGGSSQNFSEVIRSDFTKWGKVVKDSGARVD